MPRYRDNGSLARVVIALVIATAVSTTAVDLWNAFGLASATAVRDRSLTIQTVIGLVAICAGISFLVWFHRVAVNAVAFDGERRWHLPGAAVGGFLIPIWNLFRPYQVAREIEEASGAERASVIAAWWASYVGRGVLGILVMFTSHAPSVFVISACVEIASAYFCVRAIQYFDRIQRKRAEPVAAIAEVFA